MSSLDESRGYWRAHGDMSGVIANLNLADWFKSRQTNATIQQLRAHAQATSAAYHDLQAHLQASEEYARYLDKANADLCNELLGVSKKLDTWQAYGNRAYAKMVYQKSEIDRLTAALRKCQDEAKAAHAL